jgi:addiction module RelE/StbE family toxin
MEEHKILIMPSAKKDLYDVAEYLERFSRETALKYYDMLTDAINSLAHMPQRYPYARQPQLREKGYRYLIVKNYLVFYVVKGNVVKIHRIIYGKRNYTALI